MKAENFITPDEAANETGAAGRKKRAARHRLDAYNADLEAQAAAGETAPFFLKEQKADDGEGSLRAELISLFREAGWTAALQGSRGGNRRSPRQWKLTPTP